MAPVVDTPVEALSAVTLATADMRAAVRFYRALGFVVSFGGETSGFTTFAVGSGFLNLEARNAAVAIGWGRVIFHVADVDVMYERALGAGFRPTTRPRDAEWGERYFHILDPDGHEVSFARPLPEVRR